MNMTTVARPYALAAFEYGLEKKELPAWEIMLDAAASVVQDASVIRLLLSPRVTQAQLADLFCGVLATLLDTGKTDFIRLLAENKRLAALPAIAVLFKAYRSEQEKTLTVDVISAAALDNAYQAKLVTALTKRLQKQVSLNCSIDPALLGGVIIRADDLVIDGSVRGKLNRLVEFI